MRVTASLKQVNVKTGQVTSSVGDAEARLSRVKRQWSLHSALGRGGVDSHLPWSKQGICSYGFLDPFPGIWGIYLLNKSAAHPRYQESWKYPGLSLRFSYLSGHRPQKQGLKKQISELHQQSFWLGGRPCRLAFLTRFPGCAFAATGPETHCEKHCLVMSIS